VQFDYTLRKLVALSIPAIRPEKFPLAAVDSVLICSEWSLLPTVQIAIKGTLQPQRLRPQRLSSSVRRVKLG
jgi:hypothetical protein